MKNTEIKIGDRVTLNSKFYRPSKIIYDNGHREYFNDATVVEILGNGGASLKFDGYPHKVDYSRQEIARLKLSPAVSLVGSAEQEKPAVGRLPAGSLSEGGSL